MNRIAYVDIAKGIGILLVVLGHNWYVISDKGELYNVIFSFHMPLFFFLAGIFLNTDKTLKVVAVERADSLLKPYFVTLLCVSFLYIYFKGASLLGYYVGVFYGNGATIPWTPLWFLTHLWIVSVFAFVIVKITNFHKLHLYKKVILLLSLLAIGYWVMGTFYMIPFSPEVGIKEVFGDKGLLPGLPFSIDIVLVSVVFFLAGYAFKSYVMSFKVSYFWFAISILAFGMLHLFFDYTIDFNLRRYDNLIVSSLQAVFGIYITLCMALLFSGTSKFGSIMAKIGSASIFILIFHRFFQDNTFSILNKLFKDFSYINTIIAFFSGFIGPMIIWYIVKSNNYFSLFWLPIKRNPLIRKIYSEKTDQVPS